MIDLALVLMKQNELPQRKNAQPFANALIFHHNMLACIGCYSWQIQQMRKIDAISAVRWHL
jgi:hypothetical protein